MLLRTTALRAITALSLGFGLGVFASAAKAMDDALYYQIGGGEATPRPASNRSTTIVLGGDVAWNTDLMCGNFDINLSVSEQLRGIKGAFSELMGNVINSATGAVASLPALVLQKVNPALYDLLQNGVLQASEEFHIAQTSCEEMVGKMEGVLNTKDWETVARGGWWGRESNGGGEILETRDRASTDGIDGGVVWTGGVPKGGRNQPPIAIVEDTAKAGYNLLMQRSPTNPTSMTTTCQGAALCEEWASPQGLSDWVVQVVGDKQIRTCNGCEKMRVKSGMGLNHEVAREAVEIDSYLASLVSRKAAPTQDELKQVSGGPGMKITRGVIEALREEHPSERPAILQRLASEMALSRTLERAVIARRALLAGRQEPNVANNEAGQREIANFVGELEREIDSLMYEMEIRQRVASSMTATLLARAQVREQVPMVDPVPASRLQDGAVETP